MSFNVPEGPISIELSSSYEQPEADRVRLGDAGHATLLSVRTLRTPLMLPFRPPMDGVSRLSLNFGGIFLLVMPRARRTTAVSRLTVDKLLREPPASSFCMLGETTFDN